MQATVSVYLRVPPALAQRVLDMSEQENISRNQAYVRLLAQALDLDPAERFAAVAPETASKQRTRGIVETW